MSEEGSRMGEGRDCVAEDDVTEDFERLPLEEVTPLAVLWLGRVGV